MVRGWGLQLSGLLDALLEAKRQLLQLGGLEKSGERDSLCTFLVTGDFKEQGDQSGEQRGVASMEEVGDSPRYTAVAESLLGFAEDLRNGLHPEVTTTTYHCQSDVINSI